MSSLRTAIHAKSIPKPTGAGIINLKMADGGEAPKSLRASPGQVLRHAYDSTVSAASNLIKSPAELRAKQMLATQPAAPAVAMAMSMPSTLSPLGSQNVLDARERAAGMKNGGELCMEDGGFFSSLRNVFSSRPQRFAGNTATLGVRGQNGGDELATGMGGDVPGTGEGDKIPAKYEPGEFVVSNDMLDEVPSLRGDLRSLRTQVLAKKGMTPEEADAKAVHLEPPTGDANGRPTVYQGRKNGGEIDDPRKLVARNQGGVAANAAMVPNSPGVGGREPSGMPTPGSQEGNAGSVAPAFMPSLRGTQQAISSNIQSNRESGNYAGVVGNMLGAVPRYAAAAVDDVVARPLRELNKFSRPTARVAANVAAGAVGQELPADVQTALAPETSTLRSPVATAKPAPAPVSTAPAATTSVAPQPAGNVNVTRQPNGVMSFSGKDVTGAPTYTGEGAASLRTGGAGVTSMPAANFTSSGFNGGGEALQAARMAAVQRGDIDAVNNSLAATGEGSLRGTQAAGGQDPRAMIMRSLSRAGNLSKAGMEVAQRVADNDVTLRGQQVSADVAKAAQGVTREGQVLSAANANARLKYDMGRDQRDFQAGRGDKAFEQGNAADKASNEMFERTFRTNVDGKDVPDTAKIAEYTRNVNSTLPDLQAALIATGKPEAIAKAKEIKERGMAALDKSDHERLMALQAHRDRLQQTHGSVFGSTHSQSASLLGYRQKAGTNAKDGSVYYENGSKAPTKHLNFTEPGNFILPDWLKQRTDYLTRGIDLTTN